LRHTGNPDSLGRSTRRFQLQKNSLEVFFDLKERNS